MEYFRLFQADLESKELSSLCKAGCYALQGTFGVGNQGSIIGKEEFTYQLLKSLCMRLQSPEIEQTAVKAVADVDSLVIIKVFLWPA